MRLLTILLLLVTHFSCSQSAEGNNENPINAQISNAESDDKFAAAKKNFSKKYPGVSDVEWNVDDHGYHEAQFSMNEVKYRADFMADGRWVETENSIKYKELPKAVQQAVEDNYDKDEITEIEHVTSAAKGEFYDVEFKQKGKNHDVEFSTDGRVIRETNKH
jgi:hypothetical protein